MKAPDPSYFLDSDHIELIHKNKSSTDVIYGCSPYMRSIDKHLLMGVVNLNKPSGPTSHEVTAWVKSILEIEKAGHSGSLDPGVTGLLPLMLGKATKTVSALRLSGKEYICLMRLHDTLPEKVVKKVCAEFNGPIYQMPPVISAVKRSIRVRNIYYLDVLEIDGPMVLMKVGCEAGTYIRKLCHDIGLALGCGANMQQLIRTRTGPFTGDTAVTLQELKDAFVLWKEGCSEDELRRVVRPMEEGLAHLPRIIVRDSAVDALCHGASLAVPGIVSLDPGIKHEQQVCIFTLKGEAVAIATAKMDTAGIMDASNGLAAYTERVIMDVDVYPKCWHRRNAEVV
ncbi:rRNA pseudouridine synthase, putative [Methanomethylovorans hollandica DSM 15978]|uniref:Probable tRNA pseudouridine synthase B n=1 Tax=Methanomethylovorans hollandica (strain DSM 15978 / NBRC 107637 / DMS1) TaxID=867904 RepID=L0KXH6_METHD|nr:RNA-guided pseudouridylation complex pseudouridine synthase subunit Cbf5 [Methanomethylovorans hollandica]AGB50167.1 rRNA pseudouridine synthase, putative [Methanomethylovorans hollandica DSM 15978]